MVLAKPDITLEELQKEFDRQADKLGFPKKDRPKNQQTIYQARSQVVKRWGLANFDEVPRLPDGKVNISGFIRLYVDKWPESGEGEARAYFADDGLTLNTGQFTSGKSTYLKNKVKAKPQEDEPLDANQEDGPRAGKSGRRKYTRKAKGKGKRRKPGEVEATKAAQYEKMEDQLEDLIATASELKNRTLVKELKMARRRASAGVIQHSD
jgi:hypothetical protein